MNITALKKQFQPYPYHMVEASPWPVLMSFAVMSMMIGAYYGSTVSLTEQNY